ncbi:hypothetical protein A5M85_16405 [Cellulophaga lytica]|uniref:hypothetical protein n=1 Tax=Cellulophaga lytica TaxID=979 RepID=UPI0009509707|nr:hypothetical protein [Cellulophaga lytica]APU11804.1 hypothetical protein A5M85_16405 [Cellulophaga lytica]
MNINIKLVPILQKIQFASRYFELCRKHSDFEGAIDDYDKTVIKRTLENKGLKISYVKSEKFYKSIEKIGDLSIQFNIIPKRGFVQFVLDVKQGNERLNLGFGMWESITRELDSIEVKKPLFGSIEELQEILDEAFNIYEDFKTELKNQSV